MAQHLGISTETSEEEDDGYYNMNGIIAKDFSALADILEIKTVICKMDTGSSKKRV